MYVAFEGIDTVGKSTQIERLHTLYPDALVTKEPGGTPLGRKIRHILLHEGAIHPRSEALLFLADRAEHIEAVIRPNLHRLILSDRSLVSGIAYAHAHRNFPIDRLIDLNLFAVDGVLPDLLFLFQIDRETLQKRLARKNADAIESRGIDYMLAVQESMRRVAQRLQIEYVTIDAAAPIKTITKTIYQAIKERQ